MSCILRQVADTRGVLRVSLLHGDDVERATAWVMIRDLDQEEGDPHAVYGLYPAARSRYRREARRQALIALRETDFAGLTGREAAREIGSALSQYEATKWCRDRASGRRPDGMDGRMFDVLLRGRVLGSEALRRLFR